MERLSSTPFKQKTKDIFKSYRDSMRVYNIAKQVKDLKRKQDSIVGGFKEKSKKEYKDSCTGEMCKISRKREVALTDPKSYKKYIDSRRKDFSLRQEADKIIEGSGYYKPVKNPKFRADYEMVGTGGKRPSMPKLPKRSIQSVKTQTSSPEIKKSKRKLFKKGKSEYLNIETGKQVKIKRETKRKRIFPKPRKVLNLITGKRNIVQ